MNLFKVLRPCGFLSRGRGLKAGQAECPARTTCTGVAAHGRHCGLRIRCGYQGSLFGGLDRPFRLWQQMGREGVEPSILAEADFKSAAYADFATAPDS
jgi:hypothetical protein